jgi:multimeric flavodoxin WrbA
MPALRACLLNCSLKSGSEPSSTQKLLDDVAGELRDHGVEPMDPIRLVERDIRAGVTSDEGDGDEWPAVREAVLGSDILVLGTPIWLGQPSSVAKRAMERMDAFLGEMDDAGRMVSYGKVAIVAVVGNEDGAHHVSAELYQALSDVGFSIAPNAVTYWVGEAMGSTDFKDHDETPEKTVSTTAAAVRNAVHLARLLAADQYPGDPSAE